MTAVVTATAVEPVPPAVEFDAGGPASEATATATAGTVAPASPPPGVVMEAQSERGHVEQASRRLTLREYSSEVVPLTGFQAAALNRAGGGRYLSVEPAEIPGCWQVSARNYVGSIAVDGLQVLVRPKISLRNLFLLLEVGLREQDWRDEAALYETSHDLLPAFVSFFARAAETTLARGLYHSYQEQDDRLIALRGRIDIARQLTRPGVVIPTACRFTEFTADLIENSYMKAAVSRSLRVAGVLAADRHRLMRHLVTLEDVSDVRHHPSDYGDVAFTRLNEHYRPALRLARLVLENLTLQDTIGEVTASSFMLDMNDLFERFVTERLRRALRGRLAVKAQQTSYLDAERCVAIRPDLTFGSSGSTRFVADIKYKLTDDSAGGPNADLYQLLAYTTALDLPEGMLIYCLDADEADSESRTSSTLGANFADQMAPATALPRRKRLRLVGARATHGHGAAHLRARPVRHGRRRGREHECSRRLDRRSRSRGNLGRDARGPDGIADSQRRRGLATIRTALVSPPRPSPEVDEGAESTLWRTRRGRRSPLGAILEQRRVRLPAISSGGAGVTFVTPGRVLRVQRLDGDSTAR